MCVSVLFNEILTFRFGQCEIFLATVFFLNVSISYIASSYLRPNILHVSYVTRGYGLKLHTSMKYDKSKSRALFRLI